MGVLPIYGYKQAGTSFDNIQLASVRPSVRQKISHFSNFQQNVREKKLWQKNYEEIAKVNMMMGNWGVG